MCPEFNIFGLTMPSYGVTIAIGMFIGFGLFIYFSYKTKMSVETAVDLILCLIFGGYACAKLLSVIVNLKLIIAGSITLWQALSGSVVYGGIIGTFITCAIYCKIKKVDYWAYADFALSCASITQGIGRLGCLFTGCCYGMEYNGIGAISFTNSLYAPNGVQLFPSQIISSVFMLSYGIIALCMYNKYKHKKGFIATNYFFVYGIGRFVIEFFRGDAARGFVLGLSTSQFISIFFVAVGIFLKIYLSKQTKELDNKKGT
jgi:phosphatidylglycerol:prolipoprotein diacylglycerol transferase